MPIGEEESIPLLLAEGCLLASPIGGLLWRKQTRLRYSTLTKFDIHSLYVDLIAIKTVDLIFLLGWVYSQYKRIL
jgi:hypothetical protein